MTHICLIIRDLRGGGAEKMVIRTVNGLCERGHRVDLVLFFTANDFRDDISEKASVFVLAPRPGHWSAMRRRVASLLWRRRKQYRTVEMPERTEWSSRHLPLYRLPGLIFRVVKETRWPLRDLARRQRRADFVRALRLVRYLEEQKPDIVFTNLWQADLAGFLASRIIPGGPPIIPVAHATVERQRTRHLDSLRRVFPAATRVVAVSHGVAENYVAVVGTPADNITTIYNPVVTPAIARQAEANPGHPWFGDDGPPVVLGVGRLTPQKDFATLLEAFRRVRGQRPCRLVILGEGPMRSELDGRVRTLGLEDCVSLPGWVENPYAFMARASLFVFSSRYEGFGNVLVEALACGCPAVSTDCPAGPSEILDNPELLAVVGDPKALACVMLRALDRPMDKNALRAKAARFSMDSAMDGYESVVERVLRERAIIPAAAGQDRSGSEQTFP